MKESVFYKRILLLRQPFSFYKNFDSIPRRHTAGNAQYGASQYICGIVYKEVNSGKGNQNSQCKNCRSPIDGQGRLMAAAAAKEANAWPDGKE